MPAPEASAPVSPIGRIIGVFTSPKQTFTSIAEKPSWVAPMLLMMILAVVVGGLLNSKMNWGEYISHKAEENPRLRATLGGAERASPCGADKVLVRVFVWDRSRLRFRFPSRSSLGSTWAAFNLIARSRRALRPVVRDHDARVSAFGDHQHSGDGHLASENVRRRRSRKYRGDVAQGLSAGDGAENVAGARRSSLELVLDLVPGAGCDRIRRRESA